MWMSQVTHMNSSFYTYDWVAATNEESRHTCEWVILHIRMSRSHIWMSNSHVAHVNASFCTYEWVAATNESFVRQMSHSSFPSSKHHYAGVLKHVTRMNESHHTSVTHESCLTYQWVTSHIGLALTAAQRSASPLCDVTHSCVWHDSFMFVTWLTCDWCVKRLIYTWCVKWLIHVK